MGEGTVSAMEVDGLALPRLPPVAHPWVDSSLSPLFQTNWPQESPEEDISQYMAALQPWSEHLTSPWGTTIDMSAFNARSSTAGQRKLFVQLGIPMLPQFQLHCVGLAVIAPSALARGVVTAVLWLVDPPIPVRTFADAEAGRRWIFEELQAASQQRAAGFGLQP